MKQIIVAALAGVALSVCAAALAQTAEPAKVADTSKGKVLVDAKGMTLYTLDRDTAPNKLNVLSAMRHQLAAVDGLR